MLGETMNNSLEEVMPLLWGTVVSHSPVAKAESGNSET